MTDIKQKLLDECLSAGIDERASFFETLIDIILQQRAALETIKLWAIDGGEKIAKQDVRHPLIGHLYEFECTSGAALAATDSALKKIGVSDE